MYAHPAIELKAASRLMLCRVCSCMPTVAFGSTGQGCSASCLCGIELHAVNLMLLALAWNSPGRTDHPLTLATWLPVAAAPDGEVAP